MNRIFAGIAVVCLLCGCGLQPQEPQDKTRLVQKAEQISGGQEQVPETQQPFVTSAIEAIKSGDLASGIKNLDEAIRRNPADLQAYTLLGQTYMHVNEIDRAIDTFTAALNIDPDQGDVLYMIAICQRLSGQKELAVASAERALMVFEKERDEENFKRTLVLLHGLSQE
jgi:Tfp pilus assembly protein PilF